MLRSYVVDKTEYRVYDFNEILDSAELMAVVRALTLHSASGMNFEIDDLIKRRRSGKVRAKAVLAYQQNQPVGWLLSTREESGMFPPSGVSFKSSFGILVQLFVKHEFRKQKIGTNLLKIARRHSGPLKMCVCPWDYKSEKFFSSKQFKNLQNKNIWSNYRIR